MTQWNIQVLFCYFYSLPHSETLMPKGNKIIFSGLDFVAPVICALFLEEKIAGMLPKMINR